MSFKAKLENGDLVTIEDKVGDIIIDTDGKHYKNAEFGDFIVPCDPPVAAVETIPAPDPDEVNPVTGAGGTVEGDAAQEQQQAPPVEEPAAEPTPEPGPWQQS